MNLLYDKYILSAIEENPKNSEELLGLKKKLSKKFGLPIPTNADIRDRYEKLVALKKIKRAEIFEKSLKTRGVRTQSGVAVVAVLTKSYPCPGKCTYCPNEKDMPKSYLSNEPAVMRAISSQFNPYLQVQNRLRSLELNGHQTDKIELIVMGGTFSYLPKTYQKKFITECFRAANDYPHCHPERSKAKSKDLEIPRQARNDNHLQKEQRRNEKAKHRLVGLTLETRPDFIDAKEILSFRKLGCTRVELGVQSLYDDVLNLTRRGHLVKKTTEATKLLKDAGFKINYHMMPGLPGSTPAKDLKMFKELFLNADYQPDMLKIYPTVVIKNSELYNTWKKGDYKPLTNKIFGKLILRIKNEAIVPYVRIARLVRDVPEPSIEAGPTVSNIRQIIIPHSKCPCVRCREVKEDYNINEKIILDRIDYNASGGKEIFLQYVSEDKKKLFALLRLRIPNFACHSELVEESRISSTDPSTSLCSAQDDKLYKRLPVLQNSAIIREVHTYGKLAKISESSKDSPQHIGLGKKLMFEAERIAKEEFGYAKIVVISGVGVRGYYRKNGYRLKDTYMAKSL